MGILAHPWMNHKKLSPKQIRAEMSRRKRAVDAIVEKERREKLQEKGGTASIEEMQQHVYRSVGESGASPTASDLPEDLNESWNIIYVEMPESHESKAPEVISEMAMNAVTRQLGGTINEEASNFSKCRIVADVPSIKSSSADASSVADSDELPPPMEQVRESGGKGEINVAIQIYKAGTSRYAVSITRRGGDIYSLRRVHSALQEKLTLVLASEQTVQFSAEGKNTVAAQPAEEDEEDETL